MTISTTLRLAPMALLFCVAAGAHADAPSWLHEAIRKENPDELGYRVFVDLDCPIGREDVERVLDATLARGALAKSQYGLVELHLRIVVSCFAPDEGELVFSQEIHFSPPWDTDRPEMVYDWNFGRYGVGGRTFILQSVTRSVEDAIAEYLLANFG